MDGAGKHEKTKPKLPNPPQPLKGGRFDQLRDQALRDRDEPVDGVREESESAGHVEKEGVGSREKRGEAGSLRAMSEKGRSVSSSSHPSDNSPTHSLPCCIEGPDDFIPKARYAVDMLLLGLGLKPDWVEVNALNGRGLYYGSNPDAAPEKALRIPSRPETPAFFSQRRAFRGKEMRVIRWDGEDWPIPFGGKGDNLLDVIASTFFWLVGWQEHTTAERDRHGRFPYAASLQAELDCSMKPLVDVYRAWLGEQLTERGVTVHPRTWNGKSWAVALTHDIDFIETRKRSRLKSFVLGRLGKAFGSLGRDDPKRAAMYRIKAAEVARRVTATYFLKGGASTKEDVAYRLDTPWLREFMAGLRTNGFEIGLHPSYAAYDHPGLLQQELGELTKAIGRTPQSIRTHFLRWVEPSTPRLLEQHAFCVDSTLGFSKHEGFRRATCHPFRLFDLIENRPLDVWEMPLAIMDATLFAHRGLSADAATKQIQVVFKATKRVGGCAVLLWHNTLYDEVDFPGQAAVFEYTLDVALADGAFVASLQDGMRDYMIA